MLLMECGHSENFLVGVVSKSFQEVVGVAQKLEIGLRIHSSAMEDVARVRLWLALLNEVWQLGAHAPIFTAIECDGYSERWLYTARLRQGREWTVVYRDVVDESGQN